jgi:hypothetical protein
MSEPCVEQMEIQPPTFSNFIREVQKHGNILTLNELYAHDQKHSNEIIVVSLLKLRDLKNKAQENIWT